MNGFFQTVRMRSFKIVYIFVLFGIVKSCIPDADAKYFLEQLKYVMSELEKVKNDNKQLKEYIATTNPMFDSNVDSKWIVQNDDSTSKDDTVQSTKQHAKRLLLTSSSDVIAFTVALSHNLVLGEHQAVAYDHVILNLGNGYDSRHGHLTAPRKGVYLFSVTIFNVAAYSPALEMVRNGQIIIHLYSQGNHYTPHTETVLLTLEQGDMVWIRSKAGYHGRSLYGNPNELYNTFSGVLLFLF